MPRKIMLTPKDQARLRDRCEEHYRLCKAEWQPWLDDLPYAIKQYRGAMDPKTDPWENCSNVNIPMTTIGVERTHSAFLTLANQPQELVDVVPTEYADVEQADTIKRFVNWAEFNEIRKFRILDRIAHRTLIYGMQHAVVVWRKEEQRTRECYYVDKSEVGKKAKVAEIARHHFGDLLNKITPRNAEEAAVEYWEGSKVRKCNVSMLRADDRAGGGRDDEFEYEVEEWATVRDCPQMDIPEPEDLLFTADGTGIQDASMVFYSMWPTLDEIKRRARAKEYRIPQKVMESLSLDEEKQDASSGSSGLAGTATRDKSDLYSGVRSTSARRRYRFLVLKVFLRYDADKDGYDENVIVTYLIDTGNKWHQIAMDYQEAIFPTSARFPRPFFTSEFIYIDGTPTAIGIPRFIRGIQAVTNTIVNQAIDRDTIINNPFFLYNAGSTMSPGVIRVRPGSGVPVANARETHFPAFPQNNGFGMAMAQYFQGQVGQLLPVNEMQMGQTPGGRTPLGLAAMAESSAQEYFGKYIGRFGTFIEDTTAYDMVLYSRNMAPWKEFRVTGEGGKSALYRVDRKALMQGWDFTVRASAISGNKAIQRQMAIMEFQLLQPNPLMQTGRKQWELMRNFLNATENKSAAVLLGPKPRETMLDPWQEYALMIQGVDVEPQMGDDHENHMRQHQLQLVHPSAKLLPGVRDRLEQHLQDTKMMMGQQQRAAQQQTLGMPAGGMEADMGMAEGAVPLANSMGRQQEQAAETAGMGAPSGY